MQLHRLRLTAIGPFVDPVEIDFDKLSASGIFLLEGPTGAGKSTIIDAIVFALYGEVAGRASSTERIASGVAPPGVTPSVELDFSTSHGMFRVRRMPKHARRKRRGSGMTIENASGCLWRLLTSGADSVGEPIATRLDEIGAEIGDIVGLSREQFAQTVVLPQGEFATFFRADAEHRRALLQKLFGTEIYDRTVERLVEQRRRAHHQRAAAATALLGSISAYCGAMGLSSDDERALADRVESDPEPCLSEIQGQVDALVAAAGSSAERLADSVQSVAEARATFADLERRHTARQRVIDLQQRLSVLDEGAELLASDIARLAAAHEAARLGPSLTGLEKARSRADEARRQLARALDETSAPALAAEHWLEREQLCIEKMAGLAPLVEVERGLDAARAALGEQRAQRDRLDQRCARLIAQVAEAPDAVATLRASIDEARATSATLPDARQQLDSAKQMVRSAAELTTLVDALERATSERATAARTAKRLVRREADLRMAFIDGIAGHLAAELEPDQPCPVCGSREHPTPAVTTEQVDRADLDAATEQAAAATRQLEASQQQVAALDAATARLRGQVGQRALEEVQADLSAAEARVVAAEAAEELLVHLQRELTAAETELDEHRAELRDAEQARAATDTTIAAAELTIAAAETEVAGALDGYATLPLRAAALAAEASRWRAALDALAVASGLERDFEVRQSEMEAAVEASRFASVEEVTSAQLSRAAIEELGRSIEARQAERAACEGELQSPELAGVDVSVQIDLAAPRATLEAAEHAAGESQSLHGELTHRLGESRARASEVQNSVSAQRTVHAETAPTIRMADLAGGGSPDNAKAMSLPTYVLRERFVDVVASANERLATMSDGRYRLEHVEDRRGNRKSGLDLQVRDAHIEQPRDPATLSGGEAFYCSLALALGLADVVTAEAGGVDLGTLFVDEGFGTLDAETLDQVLEVLHGLASSGRVVGVVSHVPELKEQVAERISVIPNRDGSSRLVVAA